MDEAEVAQMEEAEVTQMEGLLHAVILLHQEVDAVHLHQEKDTVALQTMEDVVAEKVVLLQADDDICIKP